MRYRVFYDVYPGVSDDPYATDRSVIVSLEGDRDDAYTAAIAAISDALGGEERLEPQFVMTKCEELGMNPK